MSWMLIVCSAVNIATDLLFAILPIPMVWGLQMNVRKKIGLISVLSLGFFASATAIYKTPMQYHFFEEPDFTGNGAWYCTISPSSTVTKHR